MNLLLLNILLAVTWGMATGLFTVPNLTFGFLLGYAVLRFTLRGFGPSRYLSKVPQVVRFAVRYIWELFLANLRVAYDVLVLGLWPASRSDCIRSRPRNEATEQTAAANAEERRAPVASLSRVCPGVVAIPLDARTDTEITMLANLITLTPGSVALDLSEDRRFLYVHAMYIDGRDVEAYRRTIKEGLERRVLELLR